MQESALYGTAFKVRPGTRTQSHPFYLLCRENIFLIMKRANLGICAGVRTAFILVGRRYLVQDVDVVVFCGEGGVAVAQPVHHGAAGDNDGGEQGADAVLEGWKLNITTKKGQNKRVTLTATGSQLKRTDV